MKGERIAEVELGMYRTDVDYLLWSSLWKVLDVWTNLFKDIIWNTKSDKGDKK